MYFLLRRYPETIHQRQQCLTVLQDPVKSCQVSRSVRLLSRMPSGGLMVRYGNRRFHLCRFLLPDGLYQCVCAAYYPAAGNPSFYGKLKALCIPGIAFHRNPEIPIRAAA